MQRHSRAVKKHLKLQAHGIHFRNADQLLAVCAAIREPRLGWDEQARCERREHELALLEFLLDGRVWRALVELQERAGCFDLFLDDCIANQMGNARGRGLGLSRAGS